MKTIFERGVIIGRPGAAEASTEECMIVDNDLVVYVGRSDGHEVTVARQENCKVIDLRGRTVLPSFIDAHMHILMFGQSLSKIDLQYCKNLKDIQDTIRAAAKTRPHDKRLLCLGWNQSSIDGVPLACTIDDLDEQGRAIYIDAADLHSTWCNTVALEELKVKDMADPPGGEIHRDAAGNPSGLLAESVVVTTVWPYLTNIASHEENFDCIRQAVRTYTAAGYTGMIEMAVDEHILDLLLVFRKQEEFPVRMAMHWIINPSATDEENLAQVDRAIELHKQYNLSSSPDFRIAGIKVIVDGVVDGCTASLSKPYNSNGANPDPIWPASALEKVVQRADAAELQCALHAIGDRAISLAVTTLSSLETRNRRHRIEHLELTSPEDAKRLGTHGITASIQPVHSDPAILRAWPHLIGESRMTRMFAYKDFHDHGATIAIGTDAPTAPHLPFPNLYNATTRRSAREPESTDQTNPRYKLGLMEALAGATHGAAYSCFAEERVGRLQSGMKADFVIVSADLQPEKLLDARVCETWFGGKCVFRQQDGK